MRVFNAQFANIDLVKGNGGNGAKVTWLGFAKELQYIEVMKIVLDLYTEYNLNYLVLNHTQMKAVTPNAISWIKDNFAEPVSKSSKKIIVKKAKDLFGECSTNLIIECFETFGGDISIHDDLDSFNEEMNKLFK